MFATLERMNGRLSRNHLAILRRSLACGGLPGDQIAWLLSEAALLIDERDRARAALADLVQPMTEVRRLLNELHILLTARSPEHDGSM